MPPLPPDALLEAEADAAVAAAAIALCEQRLPKAKTPQETKARHSACFCHTASELPLHIFFCFWNGSLRGLSLRVTFQVINDALGEERSLARLSASRVAKAQAKEAKETAKREEKQAKRRVPTAAAAVALSAEDTIASHLRSGRSAPKNPAHSHPPAHQLPRCSKYPIDDMDLMAEETARAAALGTAPPRELPQALPVPNGASFADEAGVVEFLLCVGKGAKLKPVTLKDLRSAFAEAAAGAGQPALEPLYLPLLRCALGAQVQASCVRAKRWAGIVDRVRESWPEVVRQLVLKQDEDSECTPAAAAACEALRRTPLALLSRAHQAALLMQLCNDVCDLTAVRDVRTDTPRTLLAADMRRKRGLCEFV